MSEVLIGIVELAERLRQSTMTVNRWVESGLITASFVTKGGRYLFTSADVMKAMEVKKKQADQRQVKWDIPSGSIDLYPVFDYEKFVVSLWGERIARITADQKRLIDNAICNLPNREMLVIKLRFRGATLKVIGDLAGRSGNRIRQVEAKGLRMLRHPSRLSRKHLAMAA